MKKLLSIFLVGAFALSFVIGASVSNSQADVTLCKKMYCVERLGGYYWYVCCPVPGFKGSPNSPKFWDCFVDFNLPCDIE
jgi:hypothetical protein